MDNDEAFKVFQMHCGFPVQSRKMFGGLGVFRDKVMFALIYDGVVYLKSNEELAGEYVEGSFQFEPPFGRQAKMPYWNVPVDFMKNTRFPEYAGKALEFARATKK